MDEETLRALKALTDPARIRVLGLVAERPRTAAELVDAMREPSRLAPAAVHRHLGFLRAAGLVREMETPSGTVLTLRVERLGELGRALDALEASPPPSAPDAVDASGEPLPPEDAKILRSFVADDRLVSIPAGGRKRAPVLRWLLDTCFPEDRPYPEKEVNALLALRHPDVASLRRYLVDEGLMTREGGIYRRASAAGTRGGPVEARE